jgi:hypothetical protein
VETQREQRFESGQASLTALENYLVGKSITVRIGETRSSYTIRGSNPTDRPYTSRDEAALDALALSWAVVRATGRSIEYAGYIYEDSGTFTYNQSMRIGRGAAARSIPIALASGGAASAVFLGQDPTRKEVGMFHIHPRASGNDDDANKLFGPGDLYASQELSNDEGRNLAHYLGASDGAVRVLLNPRASTLPVAPRYQPDVASTHVFPPASAYQVLRPSGVLSCTMKRCSSPVALLSLCLIGCSITIKPEAPIQVTVDELVRNSTSYEGKRVRVTGYLVRFRGSTLLDVKWKTCRGGEPNRSYLTTDLPFTAFGPQVPDRQALRNDGRLVVVEGYFVNSAHPWPSDGAVEPPNSPAKGPLKNARILQLLEDRCAMSGIAD